MYLIHCSQLHSVSYERPRDLWNDSNRNFQTNLESPHHLSNHMGDNCFTTKASKDLSNSHRSTIFNRWTSLKDTSTNIKQMSYMKATNNQPQNILLKPIQHQLDIPQRSKDKQTKQLYLKHLEAHFQHSWYLLQCFLAKDTTRTRGYGLKAPCPGEHPKSLVRRL